MSTPSGIGDGGELVLPVDRVDSWDDGPLILFVGYSTSGSLVHRVFGVWAEVLGRSWQLRGVDLPPATPPEVYRDLVAAMRQNPAVLGAVITGHKLRLYRACEPQFTARDTAVEITHEVNTLATGDGVKAYACDALSLGHVLPGVLRRAAGLGPGGTHLLCLGVGGAATALLLSLHLEATAPSADQVPASLVFADIDPQAPRTAREVAGRVGANPNRVSFVHVESAYDSDALIRELPRPAIVVNATGLGKDLPGSPVTSNAPFDSATLAWDLNYRGDLVFLDQAAARGASLLDGWDYFLAGWAGGLTAIAEVSFTPELLSRFREAAGAHTPARGRRT